MMDAPTNGTETSLEAAESMKDSAASLRASVYRYILSRGIDGATDEEIQDALGMDGSTQRPRRWELVKSGRVKDSMQTRRTARGRRAVVWIAGAE